MTNDHPSVCSWTILGKFSNQRTAFYDFCSVMLMICGKRITNPANGYICCRTHRDPNLRWIFPSSPSPPPRWKQILRSRVQNFKIQSLKLKQLWLGQPTANGKPPPLWHKGGSFPLAVGCPTASCVCFGATSGSHQKKICFIGLCPKQRTQGSPRV